QDDAARAAARERVATLGRAREAHARRLAAAADAAGDRVPIAPEFLMRTLATLLPPDALVVDESASSLPHVLRHLPFRARSDYLALARSMGVLAVRVDKPGALRDVLARALAHAGPALVDVAIDRGFEAMR